MFHYPARPSLRVLSGLSLTVRPGEIVALVGPSGGGKSSIVKLVERFYLPDEGGCSGWVQWVWSAEPVMDALPACIFEIVDLEGISLAA